jgi:hypothetical protein
LSLTRGDRIELIERDDEFGDGWFLGKHIQNDDSGLFPEGNKTSTCVYSLNTNILTSLHHACARTYTYDSKCQTYCNHIGTSKDTQ